MNRQPQRQPNELLGRITSKVCTDALLYKKGPWRQAARDTADWLFKVQGHVLFAPETTPAR